MSAVEAIASRVLRKELLGSPPRDLYPWEPLPGRPMAIAVWRPADAAPAGIAVTATKVR